MKTFIAISVFISLLAQTFSKGIVVAQFLFNQDYIAQNLCENRAKPQMKCNGHCHLNRALKKENEKEKTNFQNIKSEVVLFFQQYHVVLPQAFQASVTLVYFHYDDKRTLNFSDPFFHPPA